MIRKFDFDIGSRAAELLSTKSQGSGRLAVMSWRLTFLIVPFTLSAVIWSSRADERDTSCLSQREREALSARNTDTLKALSWDELQERMAEYGAVMQEALAARKEVEECQRSNAVGTSCREQIREHNRLIERANALASYVKTRTEMANDMLRLNRALFKACKQRVRT